MRNIPLLGLAYSVQTRKEYHVFILSLRGKNQVGELITGERGRTMILMLHMAANG
jgi:hypothetical protein